jgi:hypothetical protein
LLTNGPFVARELEALDVNATLDDQCFTGLHAIESLKKSKYGATILLPPSIAATSVKRSRCSLATSSLLPSSNSTTYVPGEEELDEFVFVEDQEEIEHPTLLPIYRLQDWTLYNHSLKIAAFEQLAKATEVFDSGVVSDDNGSYDDGSKIDKDSGGI